MIGMIAMLQMLLKQLNMYCHRAQYSLDCGDGMESDAPHRMSSPEEIFMPKVSLEQRYQALYTLPTQQARRVYERCI